ncbi:hypothetical protein OKW21_000210 [Catalinimonas alkaloidigena]|nr:hypothetical protein [Catalinimonas alkaloidigena]
MKQVPSYLTAIDSAGSKFCERVAKVGEGRLLYLTDVGPIL